jgi:hypothetical protein
MRIAPSAASSGSCAAFARLSVTQVVVNESLGAVAEGTSPTAGLRRGAVRRKAHSHAFGGLATVFAAWHQGRM